MPGLISAASALLLFAPLAAKAATITIDDFVAEQEVTDVPFNPPPSNSSQIAAPTAIGGFRDLEAINSLGHSDGTNLRTDDGALLFSNIATSRGVGLITYDGDDDPTTVNTTGLAGLDLTAVGINPTFSFDVIVSDANLEFTMTIFDVLGGVSSFTATVTEALAGETALLPLASFVGDADFTQVGAIQIRLEALENNLDAAVAKIELSGSVIPVPPALPLFASAIVGMGLLSYRRRKRT